MHGRQLQFENASFTRPDGALERLLPGRDRGVVSSNEGNAL